MLQSVHDVDLLANLFLVIDFDAANEFGCVNIAVFFVSYLVYDTISSFAQFLEYLVLLCKCFTTLNVDSGGFNR